MVIFSMPYLHLFFLKKKKSQDLKSECFSEPGMAFIKIVLQKGGYIKY